MVSHQRSTSPCPLQDMEPVDGFDANQESLLRKRKKAMAGASEAEKWREVYKILFPHIPDEEIPLPCKFNLCRQAASSQSYINETKLQTTTTVEKLQKALIGLMSLNASCFAKCRRGLKGRLSRIWKQT